MGEDGDFEQIWFYFRSALVVLAVVVAFGVWVLWRAITAERSTKQLLEKVVDLLTEIRDQDRNNRGES